MDKRRISVIIPAYNAEKTIGRALASLISSRDYIKEIIVVNDGSTDRTIENISEFFGLLPPIIIINTGKNQGPGVARRMGIEHASGEWITFLDADDCLTASSLKYVAEWWLELDDERLVLLHTMTIYYESGNFVAKNIEYSDGSCGGNFYRRQYLLDNSLVPEEYPRLSEDEYFNEIVSTFIEHDSDHNVDHYNYPVYEVHHDDGLSYATSNWKDYLIKCRLEGARMAAEYLPDLITPQQFLNSFTFSFILFQGMMQDEDSELDVEDYADIYNDYRISEQFYIQHFWGKRQDIIDYYKENWDALVVGAYNTMGFEYGEAIEIEEFFDLLDGKVE